MPYKKGEGKTVLGIFIDGLDVKFVHLALKNKHIFLHDVKTVNLVKRLEERVAGSDAGGGTESFDMMDSLESTGVKDEFAEGTGGASNSEVIIGLLSEFPTNAYQLVYSISEPSVYYQQFEDNFGISGAKLKRRLVDELSATRSVKPTVDSLSYIPAADGQILSFIREDGLGLLDLIESVKDFLGKRVPRIQSVETSDISLMNLVRTSYELGESEISIIVYVGSEFSRLIFMKGEFFFHFAPVISEGRLTSNIENTIYSRILLEQDSAGILRIDRIFLAGEAVKIDLKQFLGPQFAEAPIEYLTTTSLDTTEFQDNPESIISEYAIPIGAAMRALEPKNKRYYEVDLLPTSYREGQKAFKLAWHGYLLLAFIFSITLFFTSRYAGQNEEVRRSRLELQKKQDQLAENQRLQSILDSLVGQKKQFESALAVYDSVMPNYNKWSKVFNHLTNSVESVDAVWIKDMVATGDSSVELMGYTLYRQRIPRIANMFANATLKTVDLENIRGKDVYKFILTIKNVQEDK
jgi:Tfp pilus assembly protein PilN